MSLYRRTTRRWLEQRFSMRTPDGAFFAHMPVYGLGHPASEGYQTARMARALRILRALDGLEFATLLDVGGAEGYLANAAQQLFGARSAATDLSLQACLRARELYGLPTAAVDCARLPFGDGAFDVVLCSEVIEHVEEPIATLLELCRVARVAVLLTTEEVVYDRAELDAYLFRRPGWPHMERNKFHPDDLAACLPDATMVPQCDAPPPDGSLPPAESIEWILANTTSTELAPHRAGVVATVPRPGMQRRARRFDDRTLLQRLLATTVTPGATAPARASAADERWHAQLRDPFAGTPLTARGDHLLGTRGYPLCGGVPDFVDVDAAPHTRDDLARRLAAFPAAHRDAVLQLHDRLWLPERWTQDVFDLRRRDDRRGFWPNEQLVQRPGTDGFCWHATGTDPWIVTPRLQRPLRAIELEFRVHAPAFPIDAGTGQVFWKGADDDDFTERSSVLFKVRNDGAVHRYRVELAGRPHLPAEVQWLRLDLVDGPCELDFVSLRLE